VQGLSLRKIWWAARGIARLVLVVLLCVLLAACGYAAILACINYFPPHALR
jgi:hypothetical protein